MRGVAVAFSDLDLLKVHLSVTGTADDAAFALVLDGAEAAVRRYCGRELERTERTEYYDGTGLADLVLRRRPVRAVLGVAMDGRGFYGQAVGAFQPETWLTAGEDYALVPDGDEIDGPGSGSGRLRRLGLGRQWFLDGRPSGRLATRYRAAVWPVGTGNVRVQYVAGYDPYPDCPADLTLAVNQLAAVLYRTRNQGGAPVASESLGEASVSYAYGMLAGDGNMATARDLLAPYRARGF